MLARTQFLSTLRDYLNNGWRPFAGSIKKEFRQNTSCQGGSDQAVPFWIYRGDIYLCLGCHCSCTAERSNAFIHAEPINYQHWQAFTLTPQELAARRHTLNVREAAYCLNVSESLVYRYIYEGKLIALKEKPTRVRASDVLEMMNDFDE